MGTCTYSAPGGDRKAEEVFPFRLGTASKVSLALRPGGNLASSGLDYDEFVE